MAASQIEKARRLLSLEEWTVKSTKSLAVGGAWLLSLEGTDEDDDEKIEVCRLSLEEMEQLRSEFADKFKRSR
jgi:hypothetical protein